MDSLTVTLTVKDLLTLTAALVVVVFAIGLGVGHSCRG